MCETCNLMCGKCKPAMLRSVLCPECGKVTIFTRDQCMDMLGRPRAGHRDGAMAPVCACQWCREDLGDELKAILKPQPCLYSGIICGYPCGRRHRERFDSDKPCRTQVPMGRLKR